MELDEMLFFDGRPRALELYGQLAHWVRQTWPGVGVKVQKTQITFANRYGFAFVSLPRRKREGCGMDYLVVSFGVGRRIDSSRIMAAVEPYPNRWTHHVAVADGDELDDELLGWLRQAYEFSAIKR